MSSCNVRSVLCVLCSPSRALRSFACLAVLRVLCGPLRALQSFACFAVLCAFALSIVSCAFNTQYSAQRRKEPQSTRRLLSNPKSERYQSLTANNLYSIVCYVLFRSPINGGRLAGAVNVQTRET